MFKLGNAGWTGGVGIFGISNSGNSCTTGGSGIFGISSSVKIGLSITKGIPSLCSGRVGYSEVPGVGKGSGVLGIRGVGGSSVKLGVFGLEVGGRLIIWHCPSVSIIPTKRYWSIAGASKFSPSAIMIREEISDIVCEALTTPYVIKEPPANKRTRNCFPLRFLTMANKPALINEVPKKKLPHEITLPVFGSSFEISFSRKLGADSTFS